MSERTSILSNHSNIATSTLPKSWTSKMFGWVGGRFDALATLITKWTNF
jgi:hypothetical protein